MYVVDEPFIFKTTESTGGDPVRLLRALTFKQRSVKVAGMAVKSIEEAALVSVMVLMSVKVVAIMLP
ncbi:hypothetical protein UFOVP1649_4 [uncultured Caudovirales phage]|uniref:Uncharacterized protein n=1 Tax=uncultured Caudovirales phage TaxID=2100421 RepID=A0A6J5T2I5_9CAUD|nr:hypothetical protein UFOVP1649_4 [uncultured Caudovirales phage]